MSFFNRFGALTKLISIPLAIAAMACGSIWYLTSELQQIDHAYAKFLKREAPAGGRSLLPDVALACHAARKDARGYGPGRACAPLPCSSDAGMPATAPEFANWIDEALQLAKRIREQDYTYEKEIVALERQIRDVDAAVRPAIELALKSENDKAFAIVKTRVAPAVATIIDGSNAIFAKIDADISRGRP
jgi:hypothetical protein